MNRSKRPLAKKQRKIVKQAIRLAQGPQPKAPPLKSDKYPRASASYRKKLALKKLQKGPKISKRTNVGVIESNSTPKFAHMEGERWMNTVVKQNIDHGKRLSRRMAKK